MENEKIDVIQTILALKSNALGMYRTLEGLEQYIYAMETYDEYEDTLTSTTGPLMFDGGFTTNDVGESSLVLTYKNEGSATIHFSTLFGDNKPYIFGRMHDINGDKLEGVLSITLENEGEISQVLSCSTEKLNFSHPGKTNGRLYLNSEVPLLPNGKLMVYLTSNQILDSTKCKLVFEELGIIGV